MTQTTWFVLAIIIYMFVMLGIGYWSYTKTEKYEDYVLADRGLNPFVAALSAGAADMSGWLLMGLPGALYVGGVSGMWIAIGLLLGSWANWKFVAPRLRAYSERAHNSVTLPSFFGNRVHDSSRIVRITAAVIIIVFLTFYVSSGMVSGGRYFEATFGGDYLTGMLIIAAVTVAYTFVGGFLAVSYTDVVQGLIMFLALIAVPSVALLTLDHPSDIFTWATSHDYGPWTDGVGNPDFFNIFGGVGAAAVIGSLAWGLGYFGQPHVVVRFMALRTPQEARSGRRYGISWMLLCILGALATAVIGTVFFSQNPDIAVTDQQNFETIFLDMGRILFHPLIAGLVLTAVLAAIMSTMSSQLLVVSSSLIEDLYKLVAKRQPSEAVLINLARTAVIAVSVFAALFAVHPNDSILGLVAFAWAGFGSAFGPLMLFSLYWRRLNAAGAVAGMLTGAVVSFAWGMSPLSDTLYEMVPGFACAALMTWVISLATAAPDAEVTQEFDAAMEPLRGRAKSKEA
ncbi:sodium/proline symporter PutP [Corynebacterium uberis]|uniref:sodium/proline symporter PutP n=1 Tax=Corynebacterium TaxID=1716 RepID=UPI001D0BCC9F|nr:sodium/proline symporter PutP [Corynebacterium uberis]MCZ9308993.1 sodium/proline symporter PutP [Corynebacterium sp. c6VSa_13]UDL74539.1 sodium/proline symporter PutP [Corynebacterium uberis]UDL76627.1 sodium/proline symporter PutP [Corynebacterium uberis]UDL78840.1 sodium/proline symporter PutP [Corynebacterium uberis]UDL83257.1 sodium/proline symporter PutP [Corynebacterium uberis]